MSTKIYEFAVRIVAINSIIASMFLASFIGGCGSELKLSVKADEAEKDQPSTALVRKVELTYHDSSGKEQMRQEVPVLGLSQPVSFRKELLNDLEWRRDGVFEARAYTGDGLALLSGRSQGNPEDSNTVEIVMSRESQQQESLSSALLRRIRIVNAPAISNYVLEATALRKAVELRQCAQLPPIPIHGGSGVYPSLVFESAIKAPVFYYRINDGVRSIVPINPAGDAALEIKPEMGRENFYVHLYSNDYEGCFEVRPKWQVVPLQLSFRLDHGMSKPPIIVEREDRPFGGGAGPVVSSVARLMVTNPNDQSASVSLLGSVAKVSTGESFHICFSYSDDDQKLLNLTCRPSLSDVFVLPPHGSKEICLFGGEIPMVSPNLEMRFTNRGLRVAWSVGATIGVGTTQENLPNHFLINEVP